VIWVPTLDEEGEVVEDENNPEFKFYCPHGNCETLTYGKTTVEGTMWADEWHDYVQGGAMVMHKKEDDGTLGKPMACCNLYHYVIKELVPIGDAERVDKH